MLGGRAAGEARLVHHDLSKLKLLLMPAMPAVAARRGAVAAGPHHRRLARHAFLVCMDGGHTVHTGEG